MDRDGGHFVRVMRVRPRRIEGRRRGDRVVKMSWTAAGAVFLSLILVQEAAGHGALVTPRSRNSVDFEHGSPSSGKSPTWAWCQNETGAPCNNGQSAYWYSQGCAVGCDACDHLSGRQQVDLCRSGMVGMLPDDAVSVNRAFATGSERNGPRDIYRHNPWRAPGHAPVASACGLAGGTPWAKDVAEEGVYVRTPHAHHGMNGTELPEMPTGIVWDRSVGEAVVVWQILYNHGG